MFIALTIIHVLMCFAIIAIVLLQPGKGADIGSAFGGGGSQAVFGSMGTPTVLGKITGAVALGFLVTSFSLAMMSGKRTAGTIMTDGPAPASAPAAPAAPAPPAAPAAPAAPPAATPAPAPGQ